MFSRWPTCFVKRPSITTRTRRVMPPQLVGLVAAYMTAREHGSAPDEASDAAGRYMEEVLHVGVL